MAIAVSCASSLASQFTPWKIVSADASAEQEGCSVGNVQVSIPLNKATRKAHVKTVPIDVAVSAEDAMNSIPRQCFSP